MTVLEVRRLKELEHDNVQLRQIVADLTPDNRFCETSIKKLVRLSERRRMVDIVKSSYPVRERRTGRILSLNRAPNR